MAGQKKYSIKKVRFRKCMVSRRMLYQDLSIHVSVYHVYLCFMCLYICVSVQHVSIYLYIVDLCIMDLYICVACICISWICVSVYRVSVCHVVCLCIYISCICISCLSCVFVCLCIMYLCILELYTVMGNSHRKVPAVYFDRQIGTFLLQMKLSPFSYMRVYCFLHSNASFYNTSRFLPKSTYWTGEMAQQSKALSALRDALVADQAPTLPLKTICNYRPRRSESLFWPLGAASACGTQTYIQAKHSRHIKIKKQRKTPSLPFLNHSL